jgi:hypothetical protein
MSRYLQNILDFEQLIILSVHISISSKTYNLFGPLTKNNNITRDPNVTHSNNTFPQFKPVNNK